MARKEEIVVTWTDDLDGTELSADTLVEAHFAHNGNEYVIDLSEENANKLADSLAPYKEAGRRVGPTPAPAKRKKTSLGLRDLSGRDLNAVRQWARENDYEVSARGRVPQHIVAAYDEANS